MKLCSRLLVLGRNFCEKRQIWVSEPISGKLDVTLDLSWWLVGKPMVDFLFALIELFSLSITVPVLWGKMCTVQLFMQWVDLFALKFYLYRVIPINHSWHQKTRDTGLPECEDRILLHSLVLIQYRSVTDRQTDLLQHIQRLQNELFHTVKITEKRGSYVT